MNDSKCDPKEFTNTTNEALALAIRDRIFPKGKPDWMTLEQWNEISGLNKTEDK